MYIAQSSSRTISTALWLPRALITILDYKHTGTQILHMLNSSSTPRLENTTQRCWWQVCSFWIKRLGLSSVGRSCHISFRKSKQMLLFCFECSRREVNAKAWVSQAAGWGAEPEAQVSALHSVLACTSRCVSSSPGGRGAEEQRGCYFSQACGQPGRGQWALWLLDQHTCNWSAISGIRCCLGSKDSCPCLPRERFLFSETLDLN